MIVKYSCDKCGITRQDVDVPARGRAVDIAFWIDTVVGGRIKTDHSLRSPKCRAQSIQDLMIPFHESDEYIGQEQK